LRRVRVISNNPEKINAIKNAGLEIVERISPKIKFYRSLTRYLKTKREEMGHLIDLPEELYERKKNCGSQAV
jgi:GTP cyclohydrolase II